MITKGIIVIPTEGFGNRLKMINSTYILCKKLNLKFYICWICTQECNINLNEIVINNFNLIDPLKLPKNNIKSYRTKHTKYILNDILSIYNSQNENINYIILQGGHEFKLDNMTVSEFVHEKKLFYNSLIFTEIINKKIQQFKHKYNSDNIIGIHYRDINKYDEKYIQTNKLLLQSTFNKYIEVISNLRNYDYILLITNNANIISEFKKINNNIITSDCFNYERNNFNGMIDSIVDFILLSQTKFIIGTFWSSFSDEASFFNLTPKIMPISKIKNEYHCFNCNLINNNYSILNYNKDIIDYYIK